MTAKPSFLRVVTSPSIYFLRPTFHLWIYPSRTFPRSTRTMTNSSRLRSSISLQRYRCHTQRYFRTACYLWSLHWRLSPFITLRTTSTKTLLHSVDSRLAFSIDFSFQTMKLAKKKAKVQCRTSLPPAPGELACHPYTYFTWGVAIEEILHCGSNLQLLFAIVPSEREFIFWNEDKLKESVDLRRSNSHLSQCYRECVMWLEAGRPISHLHGRIAVCMKRLLQGF